MRGRLYNASVAAFTHWPAPPLKTTDQVATTTLYVSASLGSDEWDGLAPTQATASSRRGPLATLERAMEVLHRAPAGPTTLFVRAGTYGSLS